MDLLLTITLASSLVSIIPSLPFFLWILPQPSLQTTPPLLRATKRGILFRQACTSGGRRGSELRRWWWRRAAGTDPLSKRYLFICFPSTFHCYLGGRKKRKKENHTHTHTHTEKWPRWPSLIKGIFQEQLTSLSTMLRQDTPTASPHPNKPQLPKGDLYLCLGRKSTLLPSKCHPKWASNGTHL